jgi:hypothetical protein
MIPYLEGDHPGIEFERSLHTDSSVLRPRSDDDRITDAYELAGGMKWREVMQSRQIVLPDDQREDVVSALKNDWERTKDAVQSVRRSIGRSSMASLVHGAFHADDFEARFHRVMRRLVIDIGIDAAKLYRLRQTVDNEYERLFGSD